VSATSTPHSPIANGIAARDAIVSTTRRAGWPAASIAARIAGMSLATPCARIHLDGEHRLDAPLGVAPQRCLDRVRVNRVTPIALDRHRFDAERPGMVRPAVREMPHLGDENRIPREADIREGGLPAAMPVRCVDEDPTLGPEHLPKIVEARMRDRFQPFIDEIERLPVHGGEHAIRDMRRPRGLKEFVAGHAVSATSWPL
jgi:hypothetical protein